MQGHDCSNWKGETLRKYRWCNEQVLTIREGPRDFDSEKMKCRTMTTHLDADQGNRHGTARELYTQSQDKSTLIIALEVSCAPTEQVQLRARERCGTVSICWATQSGISIKTSVASHLSCRKRNVHGALSMILRSLKLTPTTSQLIQTRCQC